MGTRSGNAFEARGMSARIALRPYLTIREKTARQFLSLLFFALLGTMLTGSTYGQGLAALGERVRAGNNEEKRDALFQLRAMRTEEASRTALPALNDQEPIVRAAAAAAVVFLPKPEAVAALVPMLSDKQPFVRKETAYALAEVADPSAAGQLLRLLQNEKDPEVRAAAVIALGTGGSIDAVPYLTGLLASRPKDDDEFLRRSAARSIGTIAQVFRTGSAYTVTPQNFLPERYKQQHSQRPGPDVFTAAVPVLIRVLQNKNEADDTRREAAFALGSIGNAASVNAIRSQLASPDPYLAEIAREALIKIE